MSGHRITPYEVTATRKRARREEKDHGLLLASLSDSKTVDLLDVVQDHIVGAEPLVRDDKTWQLECVGVGRQESSVSMVFAVGSLAQAIHSAACSSQASARLTRRG